MARMPKLETLIDDWAPALQRSFLESVQLIRDRAQVDAIVQMLREGNVAAAVEAVGISPEMFRAFEIALERSFEAGGIEVTAALPDEETLSGFRLSMQFGIRNTGAERWLREHSSTKIAEITGDMRSMARMVLEDGMSRGLNPRNQALDLVGRIGPAGHRTGGYIGLTESQAEWVLNYESELREGSLAALDRELRDRRFDGIVRRAAESGEPISDDDVKKMTTAYKNRALRYRGEAIGRTEAMASLHAAQDEAIVQAVVKGAITEKQTSFVWRTARDKRVRDSHRAMDGQVAKFGQPFTTGNGAKLMHPGDPSGPPEEVINCRCWREPKIDFLEGVE